MPWALLVLLLLVLLVLLVLLFSQLRASLSLQVGICFLLFYPFLALDSCWL